MSGSKPGRVQKKRRAVVKIDNAEYRLLHAIRECLGLSSMGPDPDESLRFVTLPTELPFGRPTPRRNPLYSIK